MSVFSLITMIEAILMLKKILDGVQVIIDHLLLRTLHGKPVLHLGI